MEKSNEFIEEIICSVYSHHQRSIQLVAGLEWGYEVSYVRYDPIEFPGVAHVTHPYPRKRAAPWEEKWVRDFGCVADTHPVFATEFGFMREDGYRAHVPVIRDEKYGEAIIEFLDRIGASWSAWVFDPVWTSQPIEDWQLTRTRQANCSDLNLKN